MKQNYLTIGIIVLLIIPLVVALVVHSPTVHPISPNGGPTVSCPASIFPQELRKCDPTDPQACTDCKGLPSTCHTVTKDKPYTFKYQGNDQLKVPNGNWCLPTKVKSEQCNPASGFPILAREGDTLYWECTCKYPDLFDKSSVLGDCTFQKACGADIGEGLGYLKCPDNSQACIPGEPWLKKDGTGSDWDPIAGSCACKPGMVYTDESQPGKGIYSKRCTKDSCQPGYFHNQDCKCPDKVGTNAPYTSYMRCPTDLPATKKDICDIAKPQCISDPCNPGGYYDPEQGKCICDAHHGYTSASDETSVVGEKCVSACSGDLNPCGNRGTCYITQVNNNWEAKCKNCKWPYMQDKFKLCNQFRKEAGEPCSNNDECLNKFCCDSDSIFSHCTPGECA